MGKISENDKILITNLRKENECGVTKMLKEFPAKRQSVGRLKRPGQMDDSVVRCQPGVQRSLLCPPVEHHLAGNSFNIFLASWLPMF